MYVHNVTQNDQKMVLLESQNGVRSKILKPNSRLLVLGASVDQTDCQSNQQENFFDDFVKFQQKLKKAPPAGLEPATTRLRALRSTD